MRGSAFERTGGPETIEWREVPDPVAGPGTVVVRTEAVTVDHVDTLVRSGGWSTELRFPHVVGRDVVGTVVEVGPGTNGVAVGDRVWTNSGGYDGRPGVTSELVALDADRTYAVPDGADAGAFVASFHSGATAHGGLDRVGLRDGDTIVVTGANGAVGLHIVHMAARRGCRVLAVVRDPVSTDRIRAAGADEVLVADGASALDTASAAAPEGVDVLVEATGHTDLGRLTDVMAPRGRVLLLTGRDSIEVSRPAFYLHELRLQGFIMSRMTVDELARAARGIAEDWDAGLRIPTTAASPLSAARDAHETLESGGPARDADGMVPKIVLVPQPE